MCTRALQTLTQLLKINNKILLIPSENTNMEIVTKLSYEYESLVKRNNVLILTDIQHLKRQSDRVCIISTQEAELFRRMYETYEFSDRFVLFSLANTNYGSLMNYVKSGFLTEEELIQAFLGDEHGTAILQRDGGKS